MEISHFDDLQRLEAESIAIIREVVAECRRPVMLYSIGKDSSVMVRLAQKAFAPGGLPFPLLHIDTGFKFKEMIEFRDRLAAAPGIELRVHRTRGEEAARANPVELGTVACCAVLKTRGLLEALADGGYDAAFGGARRDEEASRAKERVFSFRDRFGRWDPKNQRPELWNLYNGRIRQGESLRVFPLANWTERDVWRYIKREEIPVVPLYFAARRRVIVRDGQLVLPEGGAPQPGERPRTVWCRFRTLGCAPCTGAVRSRAATVADIIAEMARVETSERATRVIDHDQEGSMERKKCEGYF